MRGAGRRLTLGVAMLAAVTIPAGRAAGTTFEERSPGARALYTGIAVVANVVPVVSTLYAPRCLPGYVVCKVMFAGISFIAASGQIALSGGRDLTQTRAILYRGFAGDWYLTGRHTSGEVTAEVLPDPPSPPAGGEGGQWQPPPL
jgi:hypothetical protein